jgi:hypothetical protein
MLGRVQRTSIHLCSLGALLVMSWPAAAQQVLNTQTATPRTMMAARLAPEERIVLDGRLDEAVWTRAVPAGDFMQIDPDNGEPATEATEVRIAFDQDSFYMGVTAFDSEPDQWIAYQRRRDEFLNQDDKFRWSIDTFLDARSGYFFEMNPLGAMSDALLGPNGGNRAWDGIWNARARHSEIGWTLEIAIPFRTLNFDPNGDTWGINFERLVSRKSETSIWMGWARNQGLNRLTNAGRVTGISGVTQGRGLDIKPYGLYESQASPGRGNGHMDGRANAGIDLFYNPTPGIRANLTVNTDFAQTEVDQRQVNLTRFSLFFPERRDFFLDGTTFFDFGSGGGFGGGGNNIGFFFGNGGGREGGNDQVIPFFSRRVGLSSAGTPQKIDFGTKVTGQMGGQDVGLFHVRTADDDGMRGEDFTVARVKRRVLRQSYLGALYTRRDARSDGEDASQTIGIDARLATASFLGSQNLQATAWLLHATRPGVTRNNNAFGTFIAYPNDRWDAGLAMREVQADFDPAVGFVTRHGYRKFSPSLTFGPRPRGHRYIRRMEFGTDIQVFTNLENQLIERSVTLTLLQMQFHSQDFFGIELTPTRERLDVPFPISPTITLPAGGQYDYTRFAIRGQTGNQRIVSVGARVETGGFYSGTRRQTILAATLRARPGYIVYMSSEWNHVNLKEGAFDTNVFRLIGETQFSPFVTLVNNLQYDTQSYVLGWQSRFRWIIKPGSDLYIVYTHNWLEDTVLNRFNTLDKRFASKALYTYRF